LRTWLQPQIQNATYNAVMNNNRISALWANPNRRAFLGPRIWYDYASLRLFSQWQNYGYARLQELLNLGQIRWMQPTITGGTPHGGTPTPPRDERYCDAARIRQLRAQYGARLIVHRTRDQAVGTCRADLVPGGEGDRANPLAPLAVYFFSGVRGVDYGPYHVFFDRDEIGATEFSHEQRPGEYIVVGTVPAAKALGYSMTEVVEQALSGA
jgi:hypothetical protein